MIDEKLKQTYEVECLDNGYLLHDIDDGSKSAAIYSKEPAKPLITSTMFLANTCVL